jgi:diguanylate cyclase (GGDEF)-like protein/PAS domain S-box-containing protein
MLCRDSGVPASFAEVSEQDSRAPEAAGDKDREPAKLPARGPFVERRRSARPEPAWYDTLKSLQQFLVEYERTNRMLAATEVNYRRILEVSPIGFFRVGADGKVLDVNRTMAQICGYPTAEQMIAQGCVLGKRMFADPHKWREFFFSLRSNGSLSSFEVEASACDGTRKWTELSVCAIEEFGRVTQYIGMVEDLSEQRMMGDQIRQLAYFDNVTELPNRFLFEEKLEQAVASARLDNKCVALLLLELGRFKMINDSLGRSFGDELLKETATRIREAVGSRPTIARLSGAEFAIILEGAETEAEVEWVAQRVLTAVNAEFSSLGNVFNNSSAMGISVFPRDTEDSNLLLERADVAMSSVKDLRGGSYQFFTEEMNQQMLNRLRLENGLCQALERKELFLVYQPQFDIRTHEISGLEALLRWKHPELGLIPPSDFIGIAESSGLINPIGEWVLRTACAQARKWQDAGLRRVPVAVNVSAVQFRQKGFCDLIRGVLKETGLDPKYLELELTEGVLLSNADLMFMVSHELREMGVKLAIDDFGTGYSSLSYLRHFKVNRLKIDRSFVRDVSNNSNDAAITVAIINMAKALNLGVLAEGVENVEQLDFLRGQDCYEMQGFYLSMPVEVEEIGVRLQEVMFG